MSVPKVTYIPLDQFILLPEFRQLCPRHAEWVLVYLKGFLQTGIFDHNTATTVVYPSPIAQRIRSTSHQILKSRKVKAALQVFRDSASGNLAADLAEIQKCIDAAKPSSVVSQRLIILKARLKAKMLAEPESPKAEPQRSAADLSPTPPAVQRPTIVFIDAKRYRVTEWGENGKPTNGDRINEAGDLIPEDAPLDPADAPQESL